MGGCCCDTPSGIAPSAYLLNLQTSRTGHACTHLRTVVGVSSFEVAREALARAEQRSGVQVRAVADLREMAAAQQIFDATWPMARGGSNLPSNLFRAVLHAGGYACLAYSDERPIGATVALLGRESDGGEQVVMLHSHMAAVLDGYRNRSIGTAMKSHQRLWALEHDIPVIAWTFDPLVRRNVRLNMLKLGAEVHGYQRDFYGPMDDDYEFVDESDRVFAWWVVDSARADAAARGALHAVAASELSPDAVVIEIPDDIVSLRTTDIAAARDWRVRVREQMSAALAGGYRVANITTDGNYVMQRTNT